MHKISLFITIITALLPLHRAPPLNVLSYPCPSLTIHAFHASKSHRTLYTLTTMQFALSSPFFLFPITVLSIGFDCSLYTFFRCERLRDRERARMVFGRWMDGDRIGQPARPDLVRRLKGGRGRKEREKLGAWSYLHRFFISSQALSVTVTVPIESHNHILLIEKQYFTPNPSSPLSIPRPL
ncbi:hypothetical protein B9Z19DRAFT_527675 [Tuber borchii]|uniref:Uncharacterized protein n=1 Tax=Tuber borchii TaxID=42251 RepID=A0A2T6ZDN8_TUBBO|nr:hypothetical protein B9Z19DRAFT_527675 [Tuber borchii]